MVTTRTYRCNLCRDEIDPATDNGQGVYWVGKMLSFKPVKTVEHHVCWNCISGIRHEANKILAGDKE